MVGQTTTYLGTNYQNAIITNYPYPGYIVPTGTTTTVTYYVDDATMSGTSAGTITLSADTGVLFSRSVTLLMPVNIDIAP